MKKIILFFVLGLLISAAPSFAIGNLTKTGAVNLPLGENHFASKTALLIQNKLKIASKGAVINKFQDNQMENLRKRGETEISRRLNFLNWMLTRINQVKKLSSAEKADLQSQIQVQIDGLNALQAKIKADTDITTLKADVQSIVKDYYIFLFLRVKINLLISADRLSVITDNLSSISAKLQTRIDQAQADGTDVATLNALLSDMNAKITDVKTQYQAVQTELTPLAAQGYPGNKTILQDARTKLNAARDELKDAYKDAISIKQQLFGIKIKNPEASASGHQKP